MEFDLIISTTDASQKDFPLNDYLSYPPPPPAGETSLTLSMLNINGTFNQCGLPNEDLPPVAPFTFAAVLLPCLPDLTLEWWTSGRITYWK